MRYIIYLYYLYLYIILSISIFISSLIGKLPTLSAAVDLSCKMEVIMSIYSMGCYKD